jgi:hypothetical protein
MRVCCICGEGMMHKNHSGIVDHIPHMKELSEIEIDETKIKYQKGTKKNKSKGE